MKPEATKNFIVTVQMITYNHEPYIAQAIEGVVMQKTSFKIELVIGEDCSTDSTRKICEYYAGKFPEIVHLLPSVQNLGMSKNGMRTLNACRGKYIALCEGDDYWTDPYKLQKQVDFMEANSDFAICFHPVKIWIEDEQKLVDDYITRKVKSVTTIKELAKGNFIHTPSVLFRNGLIDLDVLANSDSPVGDYLLHMLNAQYGKIKKLPDIMAVYRVHKGGVWSLSKKDIPDAYYRIIKAVTLALKNKHIKKYLQRRTINGLEKTILLNLSNEEKHSQYLSLYKKYYPKDFEQFNKIWNIEKNRIVKPCYINYAKYILFKVRFK